MPNLVRHVLFYVPLKPGNLMLAQMDDGTYRILQNEAPLEMRWPPEEMASAVTMFQEMKQKLAKR